MLLHEATLSCIPFILLGAWLGHLLTRRQRWEYAVEFFQAEYSPYDRLHRGLIALGRQGWEVVSIVSNSASGESRVVLKRRA